jgi:hypothetical protein
MGMAAVAAGYLANRASRLSAAINFGMLMSSLPRIPLSFSSCRRCLSAAARASCSLAALRSASIVGPAASRRASVRRWLLALVLIGLVLELVFDAIEDEFFRALDHRRGPAR